MVLQSTIKICVRFKTLFYGLRLNHPHSAHIVHPLVFLVRRVIYSAIVIFMLTIPLIAAYLLCMMSLFLIAFTIIEKQWNDQMMLKMHLVNEISLYLILLIAIVSSLPLHTEAVSPVGWSIIALTMSNLLFNVSTIVILTSQHGRLYLKRIRNKKSNKIVANKRVKKKIKMTIEPSKSLQIDQEADSNLDSPRHDEENPIAHLVKEA